MRSVLKISGKYFRFQPQNIKRKFGYSKYYSYICGLIEQPMAYNVDHFPIEYLQRRIIYYKKQRGSVNNLLTDPHMINRYGEQKAKELVAVRLEGIEYIISEFEKAIEILIENSDENNR
jgi:hypothetical protein